MSSKVIVRFDNGVLVPERPLDLVEGTRFEVQVPSTEEQRPLIALLEAIDEHPSDPEAPTDLAEQHDHYLYGTPKRTPETE
jgi:predicted DNA-binding antitoxin AbrB/MazE fold protein